MKNHQLGCVCPPKSEETCQNPNCGRKNFLKDRVNENFKNDEIVLLQE